MAKILSVGIATLDIINHVDCYPPENVEVRAIAQHIVRGGNATNTLVVLSQFKHECYWAGTLAKEPDSRYIVDDLNRYKINQDFVVTRDGGKVPTSYIALNLSNGSRTIVHYRDLPEYDFAHFQILDLSGFDWLHFEGRNVGETLKMLQHVSTTWPHLAISIEIEKKRADIEKLASFANVVLYSRAFANASGFDNPATFLEVYRQYSPEARLVCGWGEHGAYALEENQHLHVPPPTEIRIVDTIGAGDTLNAGVIHGLVSGWSFGEALDFGVKVASQKCGQLGFAGLAG